MLYAWEKLPEHKWSLTKEEKNIGPYRCKKATTEFRGRKYICWYTEEIPLPYGPWKLRGLPGLILEAETDDGYFVIRFKQIKYPDDSKELPKSETDILPQGVNYLTMNEYIAKQREIIEITDNKLKVTAEKYNVIVDPFSERENFLEIFGKGKD